MILHHGYYPVFGSPGEVSKDLILFSHWLSAHKPVSRKQLFGIVLTGVAVPIAGGDESNLDWSILTIVYRFFSC